MTDMYDQTPEGKLVRALLVKALFSFVSDGFAIVLEHNGTRYDVCHRGDEMVVVECNHDEPVGTIHEVEFIADPEEFQLYQAEQQRELLAQTDLDDVLGMLKRLSH